MPARGPLATMLVGAALISTSAVFVRLVEVGPTASAFWRMGLAALILLGWFARPTARAGWRPSSRVLWLLVLASVSFAIDLWMWHRSILYVGVGLSTLLGNFQVFVLATVGTFVFGERGGWRLWAGLLLALAGLALMLAPGWGGLDARFRLGVAFGLGTAVAYGAFLLAFRAAQAQRGAASNEALLWWMSLFTAVLLLALSLAGGEGLVPATAYDWSMLVAYALIAQVMGWLVIGRAMPKLPAGVVGLCLLLQPLLAYMWDAMLFGTRLGPVAMVGLGLSLLGIFLGVTRAPPARSPDPDARPA